MKKIISFFMLIFLLITFPISAFANENNLQTNFDFTPVQLSIEEQRSIEQQNISNNAYNQLLSGFVSLYGSCTTNSPYPAEYPSEYAGAYIGTDDRLVILLTDLSKESYYRDFLSDSCQNNVLFESANYSMNELNSLANNTVEYLSPNYIIYSYGIDEMNNQAYIKMPYEQVVAAKNSIPTLFNANNPLVIEGTEKPTTSATLYPGADLDAGVTVGFTGTYGGAYALLTCGHGFSSGDSVKYNSETIGTVVINKFINNQYGDFSVISLNNNCTVSNNLIMIPVVTSYNTRAVNSTVYGYGSSGGVKEATITQNNATINYDNPSMTIKGLTVANVTDGYVADGDSGGPWYVPYGSSSYAAVGILSGAQGSSIAYYTPIGNTTSAFNVLTYEP